MMRNPQESMRVSGRGGRRATGCQQKSPSLAGSLRFKRFSHILKQTLSLHFQVLGITLLLFLSHLPVPLRFQIMRVTCLAVPPLFYIIAAKKNSLKSLSQIGTMYQSAESNGSGQT